MDTAMERLGDYLPPIIERLPVTVNGIFRALSLIEKQEKPLQTHEEPQMTEDQKPIRRVQVEVSSLIAREEKKLMEPQPETKTHPGLKGVTRIGRSIFIRGELAVNEDLIVDGRVVGKIEVMNHQVVIGPYAVVHAQILAKSVIVEGKVVGNISAGGMVTIQSTGSLVGGVSASRIAINEGAHFKGTVETIVVKAQSVKA